MKKIISKLREKVKEIFFKLLSLRATPHQIAMGFAVGAFIGIFPTFGLGAIVILAMSPLVKFNIPAALIGTIIGNPFFAPFWIAITCFVTGISPAEIKLPSETFHQIIAHYSQIGIRFLLGSFSISLIVAFVSYFSIIGAVKRHKEKHPVSDAF